MEQVFFNIPLSQLKPIFKEWIKEAQQEALILQEAILHPEMETPLKLDGVSVLTGYTKPTIYLYCQKGIIPHHKKNGRLFFFKSEIIEWIKTGKQKTIKEVVCDVDAFLSNRKKK